MTQEPDRTLPPPRWRGSRSRSGCGQWLLIGVVGGVGLLAASCLLLSGMVHATVDDLLELQPPPTQTLKAPPSPRPAGPSGGSVRVSDGPDETLPDAPVVEVEDPEDDTPRAGLKTEDELRAEAEARAEEARREQEAREQAVRARQRRRTIDEGELFGF